MTDIVERLCAPVSDDDDYMIGQWPGEPPKKYDALRFEAANEIERLRNVLENAQQARVLQGKAIIDSDKEIERLRAALHPFAEAAGKFDPDEGDGSQHVWGWSPIIGILRKARAALQDKSEGEKG